MLSIKNLNKSYKGINLFKDFCLHVKEHSIVGLAGSSGSGKSTLLKCIQGLEFIDSGIIKLNQDVGFIFQDFQLFPHLKFYFASFCGESLFTQPPRMKNQNGKSLPSAP